MFACGVIHSQKLNILYCVISYDHIILILFKCQNYHFLSNDVFPASKFDIWREIITLYTYSRAYIDVIWRDLISIKIIIIYTCIIDLVHSKCHSGICKFIARGSFFNKTGGLNSCRKWIFFLANNDCNFDVSNQNKCSPIN